jgi:hypothetical protein
MTADALKVLIIGGYGTFGGRLARLLADEPRLTLLIAGRSRANAEAFCNSRLSQAQFVPLFFNREGDVLAQLKAAAPDIVVDASGPFQNYGRAAYRVPEAAIALGMNYLDLADGSGFVNGMAVCNAAAVARGVFALSGASTCPLLTTVVVRRLALDTTPVMARLDTVVAGITPSPHAGVGISVVRAIAGYAGKPVTILHDGGKTERTALVDVPEYQTLPASWPGLRSVWVGAGPLPAFWHRALSILARLVRLRLLPSLSPFAGLMHWTMTRAAWGERRGGMFVSVEGIRGDGARVARSWHLVAEGDEGPFIPAMGAEAVIRRCLAGRRPAPGARAATGDVDLGDYEASFERRKIVSGIRDDALPAGTPLYRRLLGDAWEGLPAPIRAMHDLTGALTAEGMASVERGRHWLAGAVAGIVGFPKAGANVPVSVTFRVENGREHWRRTFAGRPFTSIQEEGRGGSARLLVERFGPFAFGMAPVLEGGRLRLMVRRWSVVGIPMPRRLAPRVYSFESADGGRFRFHVEIALPVIGLIVAYRGFLAPPA